MARDIGKQIDHWLETVRSEYISDVIGAVNIPSIAEKTEGPHPFGDACADMLDYMETTLKRFGFPYENHEYYCATSLIKGSEGKGEIGMFGHTDVVPEGEGWTRAPFDAQVDSGYIVGRGSNDNKGSTFACVYAMRFFKENGIELKNNVRLLYGCNEESGMADVIYYGERVGFPDITIVPDSWWPVSCSEKGNYIVCLDASIKSGNLLKFETLCADNTVPNKCCCLIDNVSFDKVKELTQDRDDVEAVREGSSIRLTAYGIGAHAAFPDGSKSAVLVLAKFLLDNDLLCGDAKNVLAFVADSISDYEGKALGVDFRDDFAGKTTHVLSIVKLDNGILSLKYKVAYPAAASVDREEVKKRLLAYFDRDFLKITSFRALGPHFVEQGHPVVDIFCRNASEVLGEELKPFAQAGGTYTWVTPNSFAAGPAIHKRPQSLFREEGHGGAHQPDECMEIALLMDGIKIYILSLLEIDKWLSDAKCEE